MQGKNIFLPFFFQQKKHNEHNVFSITKSIIHNMLIGTFCKTKIAIFEKARGRGAKKWRMFAKIHTKVRVDCLLREQIFRFEIGLS